MALEFVTPPTVVVDPLEAAPLSARLITNTSLPATLKVTITSADKRQERVFAGAPTSVHDVPVLGLRFGRQFEATITATTDGGDSITSDPVSFETAAVPDGFPDLDVLICDAARREPGYIIFVLNQLSVENMRLCNGMLVAIDRDGDVVWTYNDREGLGIGCVTATPRGTFLATSRGSISEIDIMGTVVRKWTSRSLASGVHEGDGIPLDVRQVHHSTIELPGGNLLSIGTAMRVVEGFPTSETDPSAPTQDVEIKADEIVEFTRDGEIVTRHNLADIIDPNRIGYYSVRSGEGANTPGGNLDWSHSNGLFYDPSDDSYLISIRHQDAVAKIGRTKGDLRWIIGDHTGWREPWSEKLLVPKGEIGWQYHQHDPSLTPNGNVMCFDNGNCRAVPFNQRMTAEESYSRVVEYKVDPDAGTVEEAWAFGGADNEKIYTSSQGGAVWLHGTGNVFCNFSAIRLTPDGKFTDSNADSSASRHARLIEVTHDTEPEPVFDMKIHDASKRGISYGSFRSLHLTDLYPPGT